jgi:hypothetical protein
MGLYKFQEEAIRELLNGKHIAVMATGSGKTAVSMTWAKETCERTGKSKVLVITTASKSRTGDFESDADTWCGEDWRKSLSSFAVVSWHKFSQWLDLHWGDISEWVVVFDEIAKAGAGVSSRMGKAFLTLTSRNNDWTGFTATPGDTWIKFYPYFQACGKVRNKTQFLNNYARIQTFKGFPEIVEYYNISQLKRYWQEISTAPNTSQMMRELPSETHKVITFKKPKMYDKILKERVSLEGELLDTSGALCAELRRQCLTPEKIQWLSDFIENVGSSVVIFYNFTATGDRIDAIAKKVLPKGSRVWRIDGKHHEIPKEHTIGKHDVVLCQWQSGSEALNLQFMNYWVSAELCYSYSTAIQARGRIKRIGQKKPMFYYYLQTEKTIEQAIMKCLKGKGEFADDVWLAEQGVNLTKKGEKTTIEA